MISPSEAKQALTDADQPVLMVAERAIDQALQREFGNKPEIWIAIPSTWSPRICQELIRRYDAAGWHVRRETDQRDGSALVFKLPVLI